MQPPLLLVVAKVVDPALDLALRMPRAPSRLHQPSP